MEPTEIIDVLQKLHDELRASRDYADHQTKLNYRIMNESWRKSTVRSLAASKRLRSDGKAEGLNDAMILVQQQLRQLKGR